MDRKPMRVQRQGMPAGFSKTRTFGGGTIWSAAALIIAVFGSVRMWTLVPGALERFAFPTCGVSVSSVQLNWTQVGVVLASGLLAIALAEFGVRRQGNRWLSMAGSVLGVSLMIGGVLLMMTLVADPLPCSPAAAG